MPIEALVKSTFDMLTYKTLLMLSSILPQVQDSGANPEPSSKPDASAAEQESSKEDKEEGKSKAAGEALAEGAQKKGTPKPEGDSEEGGPPKPATGQGDEHGPEATGIVINAFIKLE